MVNTSKLEDLDEGVKIEGNFVHFKTTPTFLSNSTEKVNFEIKTFLLMFTFWHHKNKSKTPIALKN